MFQAGIFFFKQEKFVSLLLCGLQLQKDLNSNTGGFYTCRGQSSFQRLELVNPFHNEPDNVKTAHCHPEKHGFILPPRKRKASRGVCDTWDTFF